MADRELLKNLLNTWAAARARGATISPSDLCLEYPELAERLSVCAEQLLRQTSSNCGDQIGDSATAEFISNLVDTSLVTEPPKIRTPATPTPSIEIAGFNLNGILGEGGFGAVYRAEDVTLRRKVAIKLLHERALAREGAVDGFLSEAKALASIQDDHVIAIYQVGQSGGRPFLVMPLLAGETLATRIERNGALPIAEVFRIGRETASGLAAIHAKGLVHRDLKPANIWLEAETHRVKVLDLGLAHDPRMSNEMIAGTPPYMSPEQANAAPLDYRSDLFSLGAILYECATGRRAFSKSSVLDTLRALREEEPIAPSKANPAVPDRLSFVIEQLLKKTPGDRPASAEEVRKLLEDNHPSTAVPSSKFTWPWIVVSVATVAIFAAVILYGVKNQLFKVDQMQVAAQAASSPLEIKAFEITHFARVQDGSAVENRGVFGESTFAAKQRDLVTLKLLLSRPAYSYIVAFRPDGVVELCYPMREDDVPQRMSASSYPYSSEDRSKAYGLSEAPGLWIFTAIVSESPLPSFADWKRQRTLPLLKGDRGQKGVVLVDDGKSIRQLRETGFQSGTRGKGEEIPGQRTLELLDDKVKLAEPQAVIRSVAISAEPAEG